MIEFIRHISRWLVHLFDVHCVECRNEKLEDLECSTCNYLKAMLESERFEKQKLQSYILDNNSKVDKENENEGNPQPVMNSKFVSWGVRRQMLEREDRIKHKIATEQLENELLNKEQSL